MDGVVGQVVGIVAIGMTARDAEDPLADQVRERVPNLPRCAFVGQTPGERLDQAVHALGRLEQDGAAVGTRVLLVERGDEGLSNRSGNRTLCGIVSGVTQGPPSWLNVCIHYVCTTRRPWCLSQINTFTHNPG